MYFRKGFILFFISISFFHAAFAAEPIAQEETTPPVAEGALTANQIPPMPLNTVEKILKQKPAPIETASVPKYPDTRGIPTAPSPGPNAPATIINRATPRHHQPAEVIPGSEFGPTGGQVAPSPHQPVGGATDGTPPHNPITTRVPPPTVTTETQSTTTVTTPDPASYSSGNVIHVK